MLLMRSVKGCARNEELLVTPGGALGYFELRPFRTLTRDVWSQATIDDSKYLASSAHNPTAHFQNNLVLHLECGLPLYRAAKLRFAALPITTPGGSAAGGEAAKRFSSFTGKAELFRK